MADIGDKLRSAREAKGLSIADIEKATKIQSRYLEAIEQNDFDKLPGDFYVRAFIRQYAQIVGLDGKELLSDYKQDVPESDPDEYVENSIDNKSEEVRETTDNKKNMWKNYLPRIAICLGVIIVVLVVYFLYARLSSSGQSSNNDNNVAVSSQTSSKSSSSSAVKKSNVKVTSLGNNQYRVTGLKNNRKLTIKAGSQAVTATVTVNGATVQRKAIAANSKDSLNLSSGAKTVAITLSNDTDTSIKIAGKKVPYTTTGQSRTITLLIGKASSQSSSSSSSTQSSTQSSSTTNSYNKQQSSSHQSQTQSSQTQSSTTQRNQTKNDQNNQGQSGKGQQSSEGQQSSKGQQSSQNNNDKGNDAGNR